MRLALEGSSEMELEELIRIESEKFDLFLNVGKTKSDGHQPTGRKPHIHAGNEDIEIVDQLTSLDL